MSTSNYPRSFDKAPPRPIRWPRPRPSRISKPVPPRHFYRSALCVVVSITINLPKLCSTSGPRIVQTSSAQLESNLRSAQMSVRLPLALFSVVRLRRRLDTRQSFEIYTQANKLSSTFSECSKLFFIVSNPSRSPLPPYPYLTNRNTTQQTKWETTPRTNST